MLLVASCIFYMSFIPVYILVLAATIVIDYFAAIYIDRSEGRRRKLFLVISIISTCAVLFIFKYFNFFNTNIAYIADFFHWNYSVSSLKLLLPIGLSFHTFQSLSYVIEVYRRRQAVEHNFWNYSLYVMFFPQLVAGPIERPQNLLHQFYEHHHFDYNRVTDGLKLMLWGFFKKIVIADRVAIVVNLVYNNPTDYSGAYLILATVFFAFQIYCDFSGYTDIAIGAAQVMGFKLMDNFNRPYFSASIAEFWRRWHISLSSWFKDYLYLPLGGSRVTLPRWYFNILIVFVVSGLWHGANLTFLAWGMFHGLCVIFSSMTKQLRQKLCLAAGCMKWPKAHLLAQAVLTFLLVTFGWIFFRANSLTDAFYIITHLFSNLKSTSLQIITGFSGISRQLLLLSFLFIIFMELVHLLQQHIKIRHFLSEKPLWLRWLIYLIILFSILIFGQFEQKEFIYFQF